MFMGRKATLIGWMALFIVLSLAAQQPTNTAAQEPAQQAQTCTQLMSQAVDRLGKNCTALNGDQGCYGNIPLKVEYQSAEAAQQSPFAKPGDLAPLNVLKSIQTGPLNMPKGEWGLAVLKMRAGKLPATVNGQLVTFVVYGDTGLTPAEAARPEPEAELCPSFSARAGSLLTKPVGGSPIVQQVPADLALEIYTRAPGGKWVFAQFQGKSGWLPIENVKLGCNINSLPEDNPAVPVTISGINAFYFSTGIGAQTSCQDIPTGGVVVDSPTGRAVTFSANGLSVTLRSAALFQARPNGQMDVTVLRGEAELAFQTERRVVPAGNRISIRIGNPNGQPAADPQAALQVTGPFSAMQPVTITRDVQGQNGLCQVMQAIGLPTEWCNQVATQAPPRVIPPTATARSTVPPPSKTPTTAPTAVKPTVAPTQGRVVAPGQPTVKPTTAVPTKGNIIIGPILPNITLVLPRRVTSTPVPIK